MPVPIRQFSTKKKKDAKGGGRRSIHTACAHGHVFSKVNFIGSMLAYPVHLYAQNRPDIHQCQSDDTEMERRRRKYRLAPAICILGVLKTELVQRTVTSLQPYSHFKERP